MRPIAPWPSAARHRERAGTAPGGVDRRQAMAGLVLGAPLGAWCDAPAGPRPAVPGGTGGSGGAGGAAGASAPAGPAAAATADAASREAKAPPLPSVGRALAVPAIELLDGRRFEPAQAQGRVLVLYWWASWCPFCAVTTPYLDTLWQTQRERGLLMLGLSIDRKAEDASAYLRRRGTTFPSAWVTPAFERECPKPKGLPVTVVRGRDGRVLQAEAGQLFPEDVEALARHLG